MRCPHPQINPKIISCVSATLIILAWLNSATLRFITLDVLNFCPLLSGMCPPPPPLLGSSVVSLAQLVSPSVALPAQLVFMYGFILAYTMWC